MRAIFIQRNGFRMTREIEEKKPVYAFPVLSEVSIVPVTDKVQEVAYERLYFYFQREFYDEYDVYTMIYKER